MSRKGSRNVASHGPRHPGSNPRFQRSDRSRAAAFRRDAISEAQAALCAISAAELAHCIHRANTAERRDARRAFLDDLIAAVPVYPITCQTGELTGRINAESSKQGVIIPFDDLLIGACAVERIGVNIRTFSSQDVSIGADLEGALLALKGFGLTPVDERGGPQSVDLQMSGLIECEDSPHDPITQ